MYILIATSVHFNTLLIQHAENKMTCALDWTSENSSNHARSMVRIRSFFLIVSTPPIVSASAWRN